MIRRLKRQSVHISFACRSQSQRESTVHMFILYEVSSLLCDKSSCGLKVFVSVWSLGSTWRYMMFRWDNLVLFVVCSFFINCRDIWMSSCCAMWEAVPIEAVLFIGNRKACRSLDLSSASFEQKVHNCSKKRVHMNVLLGKLWVCRQCLVVC